MNYLIGTLLVSWGLLLSILLVRGKIAMNKHDSPIGSGESFSFDFFLRSLNALSTKSSKAIGLIIAIAFVGFGLNLIIFPS